MLDVGEDEVVAPSAADGAPGAADGALGAADGRLPFGISIATPEEAAGLLARGSREKEAGNERFKAGDFAAAGEHYADALLHAGRSGHPPPARPAPRGAALTRAARAARSFHAPTPAIEAEAAVLLLAARLNLAATGLRLGQWSSVDRLCTQVAFGAARAPPLGKAVGAPRG